MSAQMEKATLGNSNRKNVSTDGKNDLLDTNYLCLSNYPMKIICSSKLVNTLCDLFCHLFMSPDCPVSIMKIVTSNECVAENG